MFARELSTGGYEYASFSTQEQYANHILEGNTHCNELLRNSATHTYLDIDCPCSLEVLGFTKDEFITEFSKFIQEQFSKLLGIKVKKKTTPLVGFMSRNKNKFSPSRSIG